MADVIWYLFINVRCKKVTVLFDEQFFLYLLQFRWC